MRDVSLTEFDVKFLVGAIEFLQIGSPNDPYLIELKEKLEGARKDG